MHENTMDADLRNALNWLAANGGTCVVEPDGRVITARGNSPFDHLVWLRLAASGHLSCGGGRLKLTDGKNPHECLKFLLSTDVRVGLRSELQTIGALLKDFHTCRRDHRACKHNTKRALMTAGLGLQGAPRGMAGWWLAVPNQNSLTRRLFEGTKWAGSEGASVWKDALRQGPRGSLWEQGQTRVDGIQSRCTLISIDGLYGADGCIKSHR